jgi:hypothetical protein
MARELSADSGHLIGRERVNLYDYRQFVNSG